MTEDLLALVPRYGAILIGLATFLSCLALPVPSSLIMLMGGAFAASGDLAVPVVVAAALGGAVLGDQAGYLIGARGIARLSAPHRKAGKSTVRQRARSQFERWGGPGVFLSRWLLSPLGPYVNFAAGAAAMNWLPFTAWGVAGEAVWVLLYTGLGYGFAANVEAVASILGNLSGTLAAGAVTVALAVWLRATLRADEARPQKEPLG